MARPNETERIARKLQELKQKKAALEIEAKKIASAIDKQRRKDRASALIAIGAAVEVAVATKKLPLQDVGCILRLIGNDKQRALAKALLDKAKARTDLAALAKPKPEDVTIDTTVVESKALLETT
jgi:hypothetical protein